MPFSVQESGGKRGQPAARPVPVALLFCSKTSLPVVTSLSNVLLTAKSLCRLQNSIYDRLSVNVWTWPFCNLFFAYAGVERNMAEWLTLLDRLDIPDGAVTGLSASDKPVLKGKLLQLPAADRPLFFDGSPLEVLKTLRTLLPDAPSG